MKKVIDGRRYDTESARLLGSASHGRVSDLYFWQESLYRKNTGEYFIHGVGGTGSKYAEPVGQNGWQAGERIMPVSLEEAQKWAKDHFDGDKYEEIFGAIEEEGVKRTVTFSLTEATIEKIARLAQAWKCSKSEVVERLVADH